MWLEWGPYHFLSLAYCVEISLGNSYNHIEFNPLLACKYLSWEWVACTFQYVGYSSDSSPLGLKNPAILRMHRIMFSDPPLLQVFLQNLRVLLVERIIQPAICFVLGPFLYSDSVTWSFKVILTSPIFHKIFPSLAPLTLICHN